MSEVYEDALFRCTHDALVFAFNYQGQQSPGSAMLKAMVGPTGTGKGLSGVDGAAQAGFILAAVERLPRPDRDVITARHGYVPSECPCCKQQTSNEAWRQAVSNLSMDDEVRDLPRVLRIAVVQKAMHLRRASVQDLSHEFGVNERTLYQKIKNLKSKLGKVERRCLIQLDGFFSAVGLIPPPDDQS